MEEFSIILYKVIKQLFSGAKGFNKYDNLATLEVHACTASEKILSNFESIKFFTIGNLQ